jgi:hypothetical protein
MPRVIDRARSAFFDIRSSSKQAAWVGNIKPSRGVTEVAALRKVIVAWRGRIGRFEIE